MKITGLAQQLTAVVYHRLDDAITELGGPAKSFGERLVLTADELQVQADLNVHRVVNWILLLDCGGPCTGSSTREWQMVRMTDPARLSHLIPLPADNSDVSTGSRVIQFAHLTLCANQPSAPALHSFLPALDRKSTRLNSSH